MPTAPSIPDNCPHERRPGLTVCLHCRHAAREAEAAKRRRSLSRAALVGAVAGLGVMIALAAVRASDDSAVPTLASAASLADAPPAPALEPPAADQAPVHLASASEPAPEVETGATPTVQPAPASSVASSLSPIVAAGRSELPEGLSVVRVGDSLTVHFDTELGRTRRPEKFERIVRLTVPLIYGARAESLLARLPEGAIAGAGELLTELPAHGVRIPTGDGWTLIVRPETRPGRDGPLVVRYIATVER